MNATESPRIAWLVPSAVYGAYWPPILERLLQLFSLKFYTGRLWPKFDPEAPGTSAIEIVGETKFVKRKHVETGYSRGFLIASPAIIGHLLKFRPQVVFASGFSLWTLLALLSQPVGRWRVVLVYEGSAPNVDFRDSEFRLFFRRWMVRLTNTFVSNSHAGERYLIDVLGVQPSNIFARPYMVPDPQALLQQSDQAESADSQLRHPVFLFVGQVVQRKGLHLLLLACAKLQEQGYSSYTLLIVGDGPQRQELEILSREHGLDERIQWLGWVAYGCLGSYFQNSDVFVFPTLEDTWGMSVLEAMSFGMPILCSRLAGVMEMIADGENGHLFDPYDVEELTTLMRRLIEEPDLIITMGEKSHQIISQHTPETAAQFLSKVASIALNGVNA